AFAVGPNHRILCRRSGRQVAWTLVVIADKSHQRSRDGLLRCRFAVDCCKCDCDCVLRNSSSIAAADVNDSFSSIMELQDQTDLLAALRLRVGRKSTPRGPDHTSQHGKADQ